MENPYAQRGDCGGRPLGFQGGFPVWLIPIGIGVMMSMAMRRRHFHRAYFRQGWENGVPPMFMEWHRRAHASQPQGPVQEA